MSRSPRGVGKIKTVGQLAVGRAKGEARHVHQFRIACLELERTRRLKELAAAIRQLEELRRRLAEIDGEIAKHQSGMTPLPPAAAPTTPPAGAPEPARGRRAEPSAAPPPAEAGKLKRRTLRY